MMNIYARAQSRALRDLKRLHPVDYRRLYEAHLAELRERPWRKDDPVPPTLDPECLHPREDYVVQASGTFCGLCNVRVR